MPVNHCRLCGTPEVITDLGGVKFSNLTPYSRICNDCINKILTDEITDCALCGKRIRLDESYSPADEAICASCDTEVTGRIHPSPA